MLIIKGFLLKELFFNDGMWVGKFEFIIEKDEIQTVGIAPFSFNKNFNIHGITFPHNLSNLERKNLRSLVITQSKTFLNSIKDNIILNREKESFKPIIKNLIVERESEDKKTFFINFKLFENNIEFSCFIFLHNGMWNYEIKPKKSIKTDDYVRYLNWEYDVFLKIIENLKKNNKYRIKILLYPIIKKDS